MKMGDITKLKEMMGTMPYPSEKPHSEAQKRGKIKYITELAEEYGNVDEVIHFIEKSSSKTVMDLFEELLDSDLFKD